MGKISQRGLIKLIQLYRLFLSPLLGPRCRFYPTCSEYAITALTEYGILKGFWLILKRLLRCHPFHRGGIDFVPEKNSKGNNT
ncbi:MAG: membrane protein insertion efficiency factor YidD [Legionellales bacterium]|nr:membrane protein insertion efficiency factor YidD [Legionellales bacterium]